MLYRTCKTCKRRRLRDAETGSEGGLCCTYAIWAGYLYVFACLSGLVCMVMSTVLLYTFEEPLDIVWCYLIVFGYYLAFFCNTFFFLGVRSDIIDGLMWLVDVVVILPARALCPDDDACRMSLLLPVVPRPCLRSCRHFENERKQSCLNSERQRKQRLTRRICRPFPQLGFVIFAPLLAIGVCRVCGAIHMRCIYNTVRATSSLSASRVAALCGGTLFGRLSLRFHDRVVPLPFVLKRFVAITGNHGSVGPVRASNTCPIQVLLTVLFGESFPFIETGCVHRAKVQKKADDAPIQ